MTSFENINATFRNILQRSKFTSSLYEKLFQLKFERLKYRTFKKLKKIERYSDEALLEMQEQNLLKMLQYAYKNTDYYKNLFDENKIEVTSLNDFKKIPFLTKEIIKEKKTGTFVSRKFKPRELQKKKTGGSTGVPLEFYTSNSAGKMNHGHLLYLCHLIGYKKGDIILGGGGIDVPQELLDKNIYWINMNKGNIAGRLLFSGRYLTDENIDIYIKKMISMRPHILRGHPSFYNDIACYILKKNIKLDFVVKGVILTAEICTTKQRQNIEKAFSTMVYFEYGHSEVSLFCYTKDSTYMYHSSPIYGYMEVLNDDGSDTKIGEVGNIVVTGLINQGMPFIRYRTGDLAKIAYRNGGIVHLSELQGRVQAFVITKTKQKVSFNPIIFGLLSQVLMRAQKYQIVQSEIGIIDFFIVKELAFSKADEVEIDNIIRSEVDIDVNFIYVESIPPTKRGKHLFFVQKLRE